MNDGMLHHIIRWNVELLVQYFSRHGPVIAIGNPSDKILPIGAAREYLKNSDWKNIVLSLMEEASLIIVIAGYTDSIIWEIDQTRIHSYLAKAIFFFSPPCSENSTLFHRTVESPGIDLNHEESMNIDPVILNSVNPDELNYHPDACIISLRYNTGLSYAITTSRQVTEIEYEIALRIGLNSINLLQLHSTNLVDP